MMLDCKCIVLYETREPTIWLFYLEENRIGEHYHSIIALSFYYYNEQQGWSGSQSALTSDIHDFS